MSDRASPLPPSARRPSDLAATETEENAVRRAFARGARQVPFPEPTADAGPGIRRLSLFARTFQEVLRDGEHRAQVPATGGLRASERVTPERGAILFVENPSPEPVTGAVFPYLPEIALAPGEVFAWVHDFPVTRTREDLRRDETPASAPGRYLDAYVGLVKSDAAVLAAHIRPDPFAGARVFIYAPPGATREVVLFHQGGRGQGARIVFATTPRRIDLGPSQIIALSPELAAEVQLEADATRIGPYRLEDRGEMSALWQVARIVVPSATDARLDIGKQAPIALRVNGRPARARDLPLRAGENEIALLTLSGAAPEDALLLPDGACYLQEIRNWHPQTRPIEQENA